MSEEISKKAVFDKSHTFIIALLCLITSTGRFVMDSYLPSMASMSHELGVSGNSIELTLTWYLLGFGVSQLIYGPLSDKYGRKPILIVGFIVFLVANTVCALAQSLPLLLFARLLSGIGIGASGVLNRAIASDCFSGASFSKAWSYTITTVVLVLIIAPIVGSEIQTFFGWRANFILTTSYVFAALIAVCWKLPETHTDRLDDHSFSQVVRNYKLILSTSSFLRGAFCYTLAFSGLIAYFQISSLLLMEKLSLSSFQYGCTSVLIAVSYMAGGIIVNRLALKWGTQRLLKIGILLVLMSGIWMFFWNQYAKVDLLSILLPVAVYIIGARIIIPNAIANSFAELRNLGGSTSGMIGFIQMLGSSLVSFIVTRFSFESPLLLGILFMVLGVTSLIVFYAESLFKRGTWTYKANQIKVAGAKYIMYGINRFNEVNYQIKISYKIN